MRPTERETKKEWVRKEGKERHRKIERERERQSEGGKGRDGPDTTRGCYLSLSLLSFSYVETIFVGGRAVNVLAGVQYCLLYI